MFKAKLPVQAINGRCLNTVIGLAWVLVRGKTTATLLTPPFIVR
jgi:hypothetical protein